MRTGTAQLGQARLADCPASESDFASHSAAAFELASPTGRQPVPEDTYWLGLTLINGIERPGQTQPLGIAWPNLGLAAAVASAPQRRQYPRRVLVSGRVIRIVSTPSRQGQWARNPRRQYPIAPGSVSAPSESVPPGRPAAGFAAEGGARI